MRATVEVAGAVHQARATFDADQAGVVDTARQASRAGSYTGVDPFGLWWSGQPVGLSRRPPSAPLTARVQAATAGPDGRGGPGAALADPRGDGDPGARAGVWGLFTRPAGDGPFPGVVCFGGSSGGLAAAAAWAPVLASHGFATLAIAYFGVPGRPGRWSASRSRVSSGRPPGCSAAPMSGAGGSPSWGCPAEASSPCWPARCWTGWGRWSPSRPAESPGAGTGPAGRSTHRPGPSAAPRSPTSAATPPRPPGFRTAGPITLRPLFERALQDADAVRAAEIPVERAAGPILLVSGEADAMWPATRLGELVECRAAAARSAHPVAHLRYPGAGHAGVGVPGTPAPTEVRHPVDGASYALGGMPAANAAARADSWPPRAPSRGRHRPENSRGCHRDE